MPSTTTRDLLRTVVLKTNPYWPFSHCNRWPYAAALRMFVRDLRARPEIRSIYLRRVLAQREWIPGLSDIDLTLILQGGLSVEREFAFLEFFWKIHERLKRCFPMLGEVEILDEDELSPWLECTARSPDSPSWTLLHGEPNAELSSIDSALWRQHALKMALWIYVDVLPPCLAMPDSLLRRQDILRRIRKIMQQLKPILDEAGQSHLAAERSEDFANLVADALKAFEVAVAHVVGTEPSNQSGSANSRRLIASRSGQTMLVFEDGLERDAIAGLLRSSQQGWPGGSPAPLVLPRCLLAYLVRHYNPYDYSMLREDWGVERGQHPLVEAAPPGAEEFAAYSLDRMAHFLIVARSDELFSKPLSTTMLDNELNRALTAALVLSTGRISLRRRENAARWRVEFPQYSEVFEKVKVLLREDRVQAARQGSFGLFRAIAQDASKLMRGESSRPQDTVQWVARGLRSGTGTTSLS